MMHMLSPKPDSFYHTEQKMALGYQNPFYLKQAQQKQQSLYNGKVLLEKHDPPAVYDSEETLQLAQESRLKMKQLNKEIKPANYTKINHLSGVFVSQTAKSREELYFSNTSKTANVSKSISIPNEEFSDDTTPSVARKFLNEVKSTIVTLQLDARVQNFEIQFLKEAAKFVRDFKSLAKEADEPLAKHKALELKIERLLRAVVSQDIMSIAQNNFVVDTSHLQTELEQCKYDKISYDEAYNDMQQKIKWLQAQLGDLKGKSKDTLGVSDTLDPLSQKLENEELEFQVRNYERENAHLKTAYKNLFDSINVTRTQTKTIIESLQTKLHDPIYENAKLRAQLFDKVSEQKDTTKGVDITTKTRRPQPRSKTKNDRVPSVSKSSRIKNKEVENDKSEIVCAMYKQCLITTNHDVYMLNYVNGMNSRGTVRFGNDHVAAILGFGDLQWGNILITRVYFVEGLGHNLFLIWQFCDSDLELWHQRLSHLNFDTINDLAKNDLVTGFPKFKFHKEHLCPSCEQGKRKRASHPPKPVPNYKQRLHLLHMDLCGLMRIASRNGKRYVWVIVDDYSRYTWVLFLISKDEAPEEIKIFLKKITVLLQAYVGLQRWTKEIMVETMNVSFVELSAMLLKQSSSKPGFQKLTSGLFQF
ncbi:retrovirus-related pol polyprotein from transposon TNT 1-94 [Tanacetum coccineum]|uniref:Retrovirus-related pol polyprotein from transposon TNT 1-94 n=1 Tax=Tanacetum coccineum TaxID=301880 RepID=A0ABQ5A057_9ASTR